MEYKVVIQGRFWGKERTLPGWNDVLGAYGANPHKGGKVKRDTQMVCISAIRRYMRGVKIDKPIAIHYIFYETNRRRDLGNLLFCDKIFEDALQDCKVIENDGQKQVQAISTEAVRIDKENPRIEITIKEIDDV